MFKLTTKKKEYVFSLDLTFLIFKLGNARVFTVPLHTHVYLHLQTDSKPHEKCTFHYPSVGKWQQQILNGTNEIHALE